MTATNDGLSTMAMKAPDGGPGSTRSHPSDRQSLIGSIGLQFISLFMALHLGPAVALSQVAASMKTAPAPRNTLNAGFNSPAMLDPSGVVDSTAGIQAIFDSPGLRAEIPAGTFLVGCAEPLFLPSNKQIFGQGREKTTLRSCNGIQFPISQWFYSGSKPPYTLTIRTEKPVLGGLKAYYCSASSSTCALQTVYGLHNGDIPSFALTGIPASVSIGTQVRGSGYSGSWGCSVIGGKFARQATCTATVVAGGLTFAIADSGSYLASPENIAFFPLQDGAWTHDSEAIAVPSAVLPLADSCKTNRCGNPTFRIADGAAAQTFTVESDRPPAEFEGRHGIFFIPTNAIQAYDTRTGSIAHDTVLRALTISGNCGFAACPEKSFGNYLLALKGPGKLAASQILVEDVAFTASATTAVDVGQTRDVTFRDVDLRDLGAGAIAGQCPHNLTLNKVNVSEAGWNMDPRIDPWGYTSVLSVIGLGPPNCEIGRGGITVTDSTFSPFDSTAPGVPSRYAGYDSHIQPFMLGIFNSAASGSKTQSIVEGLEFARNTMVWGNSRNGGLITAFADGMDIHDSQVTGNCPIDVACGFVEVAGSNISIYSMKGAWVSFAPEAAASSGVITPSVFQHIEIHDLYLSRELHASGNVYAVVEFSGFQTAAMNGSAGCSVKNVHVYRNQAVFTYLPGSTDGIASFGVGSGEGGSDSCSFSDFVFDHNRINVHGAQSRTDSRLPSAMFVLGGTFAGAGELNSSMHFDHNFDTGAAQHLYIRSQRVGRLDVARYDDIRVQQDSTSAPTIYTQDLTGGVINRVQAWNNRVGGSTRSPASVGSKSPRP